MERWGKWLVGAAAVVLALCLGAVIFGGVRQMRRDLAAVAAVEGPEMSEVERFRAVREQLRALEKAQLNDVAHDADADAELADMARRLLVELCEQEEQERTLEGVLALRGWEEPVVTVHRGSVNVLLRSDAENGGVITQAESAAILELVCRETGVEGANVKIMPMA